MAIPWGSRGLGFIDASEFALVIEAMDEAVDQVVTEGLLEELRTVRRVVVERFDDPAEAVVDYLQGRDGGGPNTGMPDHVGIREVQDDEIELVHSLEKLVGDPRRSSPAGDRRSRPLATE